MPARFSKRSEAAQASLIQTVGLRPIQMVTRGALYCLERVSNQSQGLWSGSMKVLPTMGYGNGPGGCESLLVTLDSDCFWECTCAYHLGPEQQHPGVIHRYPQDAQSENGSEDIPY